VIQSAQCIVQDALIFCGDQPNTLVDERFVLRYDPCREFGASLGEIEHMRASILGMRLARPDHMLVSLLFLKPCAVPKQTSRSCALECCRSTQLRQQLTQRRIVSIARSQQLLAFLRGIVEEPGAGFRTIVALFHLCLQTRRHVEARA
jgi:hypothetical protein